MDMGTKLQHKTWQDVLDPQ